MAKSSTDPDKRDRKAGDPAPSEPTAPQDGKAASPQEAPKEAASKDSQPKEAGPQESGPQGSKSPEKTESAPAPKSTAGATPADSDPKATGKDARKGGAPTRPETGKAGAGESQPPAPDKPGASREKTAPKGAAPKGTPPKGTPAGDSRRDGRQAPDQNDPPRNGPPDRPGAGAGSPGDDGESRSLAARALMLLIFALVILGFSFWLVPKVAPYLPAEIARHLMPAQAQIDRQLAAITAEAESTTASVKAGMADLRKEVAALTKRVGTTESTALKAQSSATKAATAAERDAVASDAVSRAEAAAAEASRMAGKATTAAAEAGKAAATATRDIAALTRRIDGSEGKVDALSKQVQAISESLARGGADGETATPELAAAVAALRARSDTLQAKIDDQSDFLTTADASRFTTQEDLRAARLAMQAEIRKAIEALPPAQAIVAQKELDALRKEAEGAIARLTTRLDEVASTATQAARTASTAEQAASKAVGQVDEVIHKARLSAASASLNSRLQNGLAFANAMDEVAALTGTPTPEALKAVASKGVATSADLLRDFGSAARRAIEANIEAETGGGILGQAQARIGSVLSGRPAGEEKGDTVGAILSRIEARLGENDAIAALAETRTLPEKAQTALGDWLDRLKARVAAIEAAGQWLPPAGKNGTDNAGQG